MKLSSSDLHSTIMLLSPVAGFLLPPTPTVRGCQQANIFTTMTTTTTALLGATSPEAEDEDEDVSTSTARTSNLSWLHDAMWRTLIPEPDGLVLPDITTPGISGFAVDHKRGFVVILTCTTTTNNTDRATYAIVSSRDKETVKSPEALTLVQLSGGLDLGTSVLPPDCLMTLTAKEMQRGGDNTNIPTLSPAQVQLQSVKVVPNPDYHESDTTDMEQTSTAVSYRSTPERNANIKSQAPQVWEAVNKLHGIQGEATLEQVGEALQKHADAKGMLDRNAFSALLGTLRERIHATEPSPVNFVLAVSLMDDQRQQQIVEIPAPSTVVAVGLALRYKVDVIVPTEAVQLGGLDVMEIPTQFPNFRPFQQLYEDAKIMDGFIPNMFQKATAPRNDDKQM